MHLHHLDDGAFMTSLACSRYPLRERDTVLRGVAEQVNSDLTGMAMMMRGVFSTIFSPGSTVRAPGATIGWVTR